MKLVIHFKNGQDYTCVSTIKKITAKKKELIVERYKKIDVYLMSEIKYYEVEE